MYNRYNDFIQVIYPNLLEPDMIFFEAGVERVIPEKADFRLQGPYGEEWILVFASDRPINISEDQFGAGNINKAYLENQYAKWLEADGVGALSAKPKCAAASATFSILPR